MKVELFAEKRSLCALTLLTDCPLFSPSPFRESGNLVSPFTKEFFFAENRVVVVEDDVVGAVIPLVRALAEVSKSVGKHSSEALSTLGATDASVNG